MKKVHGILFAVIGMSLIAGCSSVLDGKEESEKNKETGSIIMPVNDVQRSSGRALDVSEIKNISYTVESSGMSKVSGTQAVTTVNGSGTVRISGIPVGKNRILTITAQDSSSNEITGFSIAETVEIKSGDNIIQTVTWITTAKADVYKKLLSSGKEIAEFTEAQDSWIDSAVPAATPAYLVDSDSIVSDFESLNTGGSYKLTAGSVKFTAYGADGYKICVNDPASVTKTVSEDGEQTITDVAPGTWSVNITDADGTVTKKSITVLSGAAADLGTVGNPLTGKLFIFVKSSSAPTVWAWIPSGTSLSEAAGETWETQRSMTNATSVYMAAPDGWYMTDFSSVLPLSGTAGISFKLNKSNPEITSGKMTTFWYDGSSFYDSDPTESQKSSDTSLSDIKVNGVSAGAGSTTYSIAASVTSAAVTATASHSAAAVSVTPSGSVEIASGASQVFTIKVTAEDGTTKDYTITVNRAVENDTSLASVKVGSAAATLSGTTYTAAVTGSDETLSASITAVATDSANATVTVVPPSVSLAGGGSSAHTITVTNGSKSTTYTLNVSYTHIEGTQYYWTNKNGAVGTNKTISSWSDWTSTEQIAQCSAYDDPRTWKGIQETPYDVYAMYAAYDDTNLYLMVELTNIADDSIFMAHSYAGSDNAWWDNRDCPLGFIINTEGKATSPQTAGSGPIWGTIDFSDSNGFDYLLYHSSKYGYAEHKSAFVGVGTPGFFVADSSGTFNYADGCLSVNTNVTATSDGTQGTKPSGIAIRYNRGCAVSRADIYYESTPTDNRATSAQTGADLLASTTYSKVTSSHDTELDMSYWYTIPLSSIGMTKATLESTGIGVRQITPNGGSLMDCCPWDISMVDNAAEACSDDESTSKEKEDVDNITSPQARVGHM